MLSPLRQRLVSRCLVQLPAIWGKLPNQADYIRHRCSVAEAQAWQRWASEFWLRPTMAARTRPAARPRQQWVELNAPVAKPDLELVPVSFVLLPGMLDFAPDHFVQGVCVTSHDSVGRQCPLIIFQKITPCWMRRSMSSPSSNQLFRLPDFLSRFGGCDTKTGFLFWIARIAARLHAADLSSTALAQLVDQVWTQFEPGWMQLVGRGPTAVQSDALLLVLEQYHMADQDLDTANGLRGVSRLPWINWPQALLRNKDPFPAFWQQDVDGGYVNASDNLVSLRKNSL
ncbi:type VI secretion system protein ImpM [Oxalobacteraceae bacterium GrIS 2.11]